MRNFDCEKYSECLTYAAKKDIAFECRDCKFISLPLQLRLTKLCSYSKKYYKKNRKKVSYYYKQWCKNNPDKLLENRKKYYENNKEKVIARSAAYYKKNREKILAMRKIRCEKNKIDDTIPR